MQEHLGIDDGYKPIRGSTSLHAELTDCYGFGLSAMTHAQRLPRAVGCPTTVDGQRVTVDETASG